MALRCSNNLFSGGPSLIRLPKKKQLKETTKNGRFNEEIRRLCESNNLGEVFSFFYSNNAPSSSFLYGCLLQSCTRNRFLEGGVRVHLQIIKSGFKLDGFVLISLLNMYIKCGYLQLARKVFDDITPKSLIAWNTMISGYCSCGALNEALALFKGMLLEEHQPDQYTLSSIIKGCQDHHDLLQGEQLHSLAIKFGYVEDEFVINALIDLYASCASIDDAFRVFDGSLQKSATTWNSIMARSVEHELYSECASLYMKMKENGVAATEFTFSSILRACTGLEKIDVGDQVHAQVIVHGFISDIVIRSALLDLYVKCGDLRKGRKLFDSMHVKNVIIWNTLIRGYGLQDKVEEAFLLFKMMRYEGLVLDIFTFPAVLSGATSDHVFKEYTGVHGLIIKTGYQRDPFVGTALVAMYSANQSLEEARYAFEDIELKDVASWSSMIAANVQNGEVQEALRILHQVLELGIKPNQFMYSTVFSGCSKISSLEIGKQIHSHGIRSGFFCDGPVSNSLLTMYSNCGCITEARKIFKSVSEPTVASYNAMISALAQHGDANEAFLLFRTMQFEGLEPDSITVLGVLSACNHAGLVDEGHEFFYTVKESHGIDLNYQHYACVADILSRAGRLDEAERFISNMPFEPGPSVWLALLGACRKHGNIELGSKVAKLLIEMEPDEAITYVLLTNIYTSLGRMDEAKDIRDLMKTRGIKKDHGVSWIEIRGEMHSFVVEDQKHPCCSEIYRKLDILISRIKEVGYVPDMTSASFEWDDVERERSLFYHSEKLAITFGLLTSTPGTVIRVMQNLRVCNDCHSAIKYISLVTGRDIVLRDNHRFHHFKGGSCSCSCGDYW
uniref:DYW domain-containing protein n=1 Tax=Nymphaea colorata TaxID=210225 RepID=A0A5K0VK48_9MAGN